MSRISQNEKLQAVYNAILKFIGENGISPSVREICKITGIWSTSSVHSALDRLEELGAITKSDQTSRSIRLAGSGSTAVIPLLGRVTAGNPVLAFEDVEGYIPFSYPRSKDGLFALKVMGDSMINAGILDGDIVIADKNIKAEKGDIVIGMDCDSATVKRLSYDNGKIIFLPENQNYQPIYPENPSILGKVVGVFREY